jgi:Ca-activated chloride channel family protein
MKTLFSFLFTFGLLAGIGFSQVNVGSISGVVTVDQIPVENAIVTLTNETTRKNIIAKTTVKGEFSFVNLAVGTYSIQVDHIAYLSYSQFKIAVEAGKKVNLAIALLNNPPQILDMEEIAPRESVKLASKTESNSYGWTYKPAGDYFDNPSYNTESYNSIEENGYRLTSVNPLSTFSIDVDAASYSNVRRFLLSGQKPEKGAVRIEEMINYFSYDYPDPVGNDPFSITTEIGDCPWNKNKLVHIGLQGKRIKKENLPPNNLVFLLDVSGSMDAPNKLPLLKSSFKLLVNELGKNDRIAIVVYAGAAGVVLNSTVATNSTPILEALENLQAGGSTAGGQGLELAYKIAQENFIKEGNNRVILATDGDFNVGMSSDDAMENLIVKKRETGIFLTCLGFGTGNYKDSKMETLADKGNGNYAYIDNLLEAKKVLVTEMGATLVTIAKDVKIQVEFNPALIASYRLIGYENRLLNAEDFNDDKKDAGEIGAGHSVTALYEIVLKGEEGEQGTTVDPLRYQQPDQNLNENKTAFGDEVLTVKFRYKAPDQMDSKLIQRNLKNTIIPWVNLSNDYKFSASVAGFGMLLRESEFAKNLTFDQLIEWANQSKGKDENGYRAEFIRLVEMAKAIYK